MKLLSATRRALLLIWAISAHSHAEVVVTSVPPAAAQRGIALQIGDHLELPPCTGAKCVNRPLTVFSFFEIQTRAAWYAPTEFVRIRGSAQQSIHLPIGRWDVSVAPREVLNNQDPATLLTRALETAARGEFDAAYELFDHAAKAAPEHASLIWLQAALASERFLDPKRERMREAATRALAKQNPDAATWSESLRVLAFAQLQNRERESAAQTLALARTKPCGCLHDAEFALLEVFLHLRGGSPEAAEQALNEAETLIKAWATQGTERALVLQRKATRLALQRDGENGAMRASAAFEAAIQQTQLVAPDSVMMGRVAFNAHLHALELRRFASAEAFARRSLAAFSRAAPHSLEVGQARAALAEIYLRRLEFAKAQPLLEASANSAMQLAENSYEAISLQLQLADVELQLQRFDEATRRLDAISARLQEPTLLGETNVRADLAWYRANLAAEQKHWEHARDLAGAATALYSKATNIGVNVWQSHRLISTAHLALAQPKKALAEADLAIKGLQTFVAADLALAQALAARARALRALGQRDLAIDAYAAAIKHIEAARSQVGGSETIQARWAAQFQDYYHELFALLSLNADGAVQIQQWLYRYRNQSQQQLTRGSDFSWAARERTASLRLAAGTARLEFLIGPEQSFLLIEHAAQAPALIPLAVTRTELTRLVERCGLLLAHEQMQLEALDRLGEQLFDALFTSSTTSDSALSSLQRALEAEHWLIQNDGPLHNLPWAVLRQRSKAHSSHYLVESKLISILVPATSRRSNLLPGREIITFADPALGATVDVNRASSPSMGSLPGAREELRQLRSLYPQLQSFVGSAATEAHVRRYAPQAQTLHFALHSESNSQTPMASAMRLANSTTQNPREDGLLHAEEIANEFQINADLVVLSSCASARGGNFGGDGLLGLVSAWQHAGANSVIASLWPVHDHATAIWMRHFYQARARGIEPDRAVAQAQRQWLLKAREEAQAGIWQRLWHTNELPEHAQHPFFWAAFQYYVTDG